MNIREANRVRACCDCGEPGALLWRTTKGENAGRLLRICAACLRKDSPKIGWRSTSPKQVPTEFVEGEWCWPTDDSDPAAVVTYSKEPSPETGHVGWMWWALGAMGDAPTYEAACTAAVAEIQRRMDRTTMPCLRSLGLWWAYRLRQMRGSRGARRHGARMSSCNATNEKP